MENGVLLRRDGTVARITLDRPAVGNAIDIPMARSFMESVICCDEDDSIRCVLITGSGRLFCAGGDVVAFNAAGDNLPGFLSEITAYLHSGISRLLRMNKPVVTAVNGPAAGAGVGLAVLGDIALAAPTAHFTLAYTGIGLSPDGAATWLLPRLVGLRRAQELALRNQRVKAEEAAAMGLITRVVEGDALQQEAVSLSRELSRSATSALGVTRRLLLDSFSTQVETQMERESRAIAAQARTSEGREGVAAFVEKRAPSFARES
jgi:2-(1,2-epoxy-1,2-dihydrophenyl)acetyl-CoA isomerase